jgi:hypothetical protein
MGQSPDMINDMGKKIDENEFEFFIDCCPSCADLFRQSEESMREYQKIYF